MAGRSPVVRGFSSISIVAVGAISVLVLASALQWAGQPFPGFFLDPNLLISGPWNEGWTGPKAGLAHHDRVLSVDGQPVNSSQQVLNLVSTRGVGAPLTYTVERGAEIKEIAVATMRFHWRDLVVFFVVPFVSGAASLLLGSLVYTQCREVDVGQVFLFLCLSFALFAITLFDLVTSHLVSRLWAVALPFTIATMLHLALIFPERQPILRGRPALRFIPYAPAGLLAFLSLIFFTDPRGRLLLQRLAYAWAALGFGLFLVLVARTYRWTGSAPVRRQAKVILWASVVTLIPVGAWAIISIWRCPLAGVQMVVPCFLLVPASIAYVIARYRLFQLERLVSQGMVFFSLIALLALLYFLLLAATQRVFQDTFGQPSSLLALGTALLVAPLFHPLRSWLQSAVDGAFHRERAMYQRPLVDLSRSVRAGAPLDDVMAQLVEWVGETMHVAHASVLLRNDSQGDYRLAEQWGQPDGPEISLGMDHPLVARLAQGQMVAAEAMTEALEEDILAQWGAVLAVPLIAQGELVGLLALGPKPSEEVCTSWDRELLLALSDQAATAITMGRLTEQIRARERMDQELRMARQIQTSFLPKVACEIPGFDIAAYWRAAREVGGDFYDFIPLSSGRMGLVIADVSDKGVPAALFMALSRALVRASAAGSPTPDEALRRANEFILADASSGMFVTLLYAILDPASHRMAYVNAGHMPPLLGRQDGVLSLRSKGIALGVTEDLELETREVQLTEGDVIVLYTDGVTDAINEKQEEFGQTRLAKVVAENRHLTAEGLMEKIDAAVTSFVGGERQFDDFTLLVLKYVDEELWSGLCLIDESEGRIPRPFLS